MQYVGSKNRIAKHILPYIFPNGRDDNQLYVEPFVGGCNMIDKVTGRRWGNDLNPYVIAMFKALQNGWEPPEYISKEEYYKIKQNQDQFPKELVCFVGFNCSFGSKWWGGYAKNAKGTNYAKVAKNNILKQINNLKGVKLTNLPYNELILEPGCIVYCDPPYECLSKPYDSKSFNHEEFWQWVRDNSKDHNIYVSEYEAPEDFKCLVSVDYYTLLNKNKRSVRIERLFTYDSARH